jgi:adenosine deaminase
MRDLAELPKAHLHVHLEGAMRPETLAELAGHYGIDVPAIRGYGSFTAFATTYLAACDVLRTPDDLRRVVDEVVEDAADAGAVWVEPSFYAPHHLDRLGPGEAVVELVLDALATSAGRHGIGAGLMLAADRTMNPAVAVEQAKLAASFAGRGVVSFGLANDEAPFPPEPFEEAFRIARDAGLLSTPHAGELAGAASVRAAVEVLGADRIQHGVRAVEDARLLELLAERGICCDVCPTSNVMLSVVPTLEAHALPALLDAGVPCSVNADDPLLFGPNLLDEYELCRRELGFDDDRMAHIAACSIQFSGASSEQKVAASERVSDWLAAG